MLSYVINWAAVLISLVSGLANKTGPTNVVLFAGTLSVINKTTVAFQLICHMKIITFKD